MTNNEDNEMKLTTKITLAGCLIASSLSCIAEEKKDTRSFKTTQVAPGLYMIAGVGGFTGGNIGLSTGVDGVVMIDDSMPPLLGRMKDAISSITPKPVDFLINTHVHGDHTGNNEAMGKSGTRIVAHENLRLRMVNKGVMTSNGDVPAPKAALPVITFSHSMNFHLNDQDAKIFHVSEAHTDGDAVIYFKQANVIHTGDTMFSNMFPFIDFNNGGSLDGYIEAQKTIYKLANDKTKIIPGHGELATKADLKNSIEMLKESKKIIAELVAKGKSEEEIVALNPLAKFHDKWNWGFITTEKMTRQVYKGIKASGKKKHKHHKKEKDHSH
ncbi:MBL fold metallo-hydrolase [Aliikangiella maris]|uniref:MBL fold metallo-hydrolase n=2 Tax=Aliikangiella maris TaxID=3162458 RepID=A0ABV3MP07_9GAMM